MFIDTQILLILILNCDSVHWNISCHDATFPKTIWQSLGGGRSGGNPLRQAGDGGGAARHADGFGQTQQKYHGTSGAVNRLIINAYSTLKVYMVQLQILKKKLYLQNFMLLIHRKILYCFC